MATLTAARPLVRKIPTTMKAAVIDRFGPPEVLKLHTVPTPKPHAGEVLIALHAAGIGVWDAEMRGGWWPAGKPRFPLVLGTDGAGVVAALGKGVRRFKLGDRVWGFEFINPRGGFYAEYVALSAKHAGRIPESLDLLHAGAGAVTGLTALQGVNDQLKVKRGEAVLIFGASGAVGTLAVQFAKRRGAIVIGAARGRDAMRLVKKLGADAAIDVTGKDYIAQLRAAAPRGLDAALALAGGDALEKCLDLVNRTGRIAYPHGVEPPPRKRPTIRVIAYDAKYEPVNLSRLNRAVDETDLEIPIADVYPLAQAAKAHARVEKGHVLGRVVLRIRPKNG